MPIPTLGVRSGLLARSLAGSGTLDADELRTLLRAVFKNRHEVYVAAMDIAHKVSSNGNVSLLACGNIFEKLELDGHMGQIDGADADESSTSWLRRPQLAQSAGQISLRIAKSGRNLLGLNAPRAHAGVDTVSATAAP